MSTYIRNSSFPLLALLLSAACLPAFGASLPALPSQQFEANAEHLDRPAAEVGSFRTRIGQRIIASPVLQDGFLWVATGQGGKVQSGQVAKLDPQDGHVLWKKQLPNIVMTQPIVSQGLVIVGLGGNRMYFLNPGYTCHSPYEHAILGLSTKTGQVLWTHPTRCQDMPTFVAVDGLVMGPTGGKQFLALDPTTGRTVWKLPLAGWSAMSSPALAGDNLYFGTDDGVTGTHRFYDINWKERRIVWSHNFPRAVNLGEASPVLSHGLVFTAYMEKSAVPLGTLWSALRDGKSLPAITFRLAAMDAKNGRLVYDEALYSVPTNPWKWLSFSGSVWISSRDSDLEAWFHQELPALHLDQRLFASEQSGKQHPGIHNPPLTAWHNLIFVEPRVGGRLFALDARTGLMRWQLNTGPDISNPNIRDGWLYTVNARGVLYVVNAQTGKLAMTQNLGTGVVGPAEVVLTPGHLITGGSTGILVSEPDPVKRIPGLAALLGSGA